MHQAPQPVSQHPADLSDAERFATGERVTWVSVAVNVLLTIMQLIVGFWAHSQSLIADAMHTLSDIVGDAFVLIANRHSHEAADDDHPYGHGRYETAASLVLGLLLALTGGGILLAASERLIAAGAAGMAGSHEFAPVGEAALWAALFTVAAKEGLFHYMLRAAQRVRSPMLIANAWHARADALSSLVVVVGIGGALAGFPVADAVAAIIVGAMIVRVGLRFMWESLQELIDTGLDPAAVAAIRATLHATPGVVDLHDLRTRRMAHQVLVDAHVQVGPRISVSEGHRIAESARERVLACHPDVLDVLVHIDPEDEAQALLGDMPLPDRQEALAALVALMGADAPDADHLARTRLHYLGQRIEVEMVVSGDCWRDVAQRARLLALRESAPRVLPWLHSLSFQASLDD
jgi:cation diffusion facilitator family transporter